MSIRLRGVTKVYPQGVRALDGVDMDIEGMFGLVGPNGAGKTTLMRIITTMLLPTEGRVEVAGRPIDDPQAVRRVIGYLPQHVDFYPRLTALETLEYYAALSEVRRTASELLRTLETVGLSEVANRPVGRFSGGMRRRLGLATAIVHDPKVIVVDEPTSGLDPEGRLEVRRVLGAISGGGRTVLLSTHILPDIESTCSRMAVLHKGRVRFVGSPAELADRARGKVVEAELAKDDLSAFSANHHVLAVRHENGRVRVRTFLEEEKPSWNYEQVEPTTEDGYFLLLGQGGHPTHREAT